MRNQNKKNRAFWIEYLNGFYPAILKKYNGDVTELNAEIKNAIFDFINKNKETTYVKTRKKIYVNEIENEEIAVFCTQKNITRPELAELIKKELMDRYK